MVKWGKPYAKPCHSMPTMHLCQQARIRVTANKHGPLPPKPPHTQSQSGCGQLVKLSPATFDPGCVKTHAPF